jgi:hypothetical protein
MSAPASGDSGAGSDSGQADAGGPEPPAVASSTPGAPRPGQEPSAFWRQQEQIRLVEADYGQTNEFIDGVVGTAGVIRGAGITVWLALVGFAFQQNLFWLAVLGGIVAAVFWLVDGYHGWLYAEAAEHLKRSEWVMSAYYRALGGRDAPPPIVKDAGGALKATDSAPEETAQQSLAAELRDYSFGLFEARRRQTIFWSFPARAKPRVIYRALYPALIVIAAASAVLVGAAGAGKQPETAPAPPGREHLEKSAVAAVNASVKIQLTKLSKELSASKNPATHDFGVKLGDVLGGAGGLAAGLALLESSPEVAAAGGVAGTVADVLGGIASDFVKGGFSYTGGSTYDNVTISPNAGTSFSFDTGQSGPASANPPDCIAYLVELDELVDDDHGIAALLPGHEFPRDAAEKACKLEGRLTDSSPLVRALAKH